MNLFLVPSNGVSRGEVRHAVHSVLLCRALSVGIMTRLLGMGSNRSDSNLFVWNVT